MTQIPGSVEEVAVTTPAPVPPAMAVQSHGRATSNLAFPNHYAWLLLFSALDIMLTHTIGRQRPVMLFSFRVVPSASWCSLGAVWSYDQ